MPDDRPAPRLEVFILLNGPFVRPPDLPKTPPEGSLVLAVDGGALHALELDWPVRLLLGDFDSLSQGDLARVQGLGPDMEVRSFPKDKDETDFELALAVLAPMAGQIAKVTVLGALGGRWDMTLANLLSPLAEGLGLFPPAGPGPSVVFQDGLWSLHLLVGPAELDFGPSGVPRRVSLLPLLGEASGATLAGAFKYPLSGGVLRPCYTLGLSNELYGDEGTLSLEAGILLVTVSPLSDEGRS